MSPKIVASSNTGNTRHATYTHITCHVYLQTFHCVFKSQHTLFWAELIKLNQNSTINLNKKRSKCLIINSDFWQDIVCKIYKVKNEKKILQVNNIENNNHQHFVYKLFRISYNWVIFCISKLFFLPSNITMECET